MQKQVQELADQRLLLLSYNQNLEAATSEIQGKTKELNAAHSRCHELESQLLQEKESVGSLEAELTKERKSLEDKLSKLSCFKRSLFRRKMSMIAELTGNLASSVEGGEMDIYALLDDEISSTGTALKSNLHKHNQLEADIEKLKESLHQKDMGLRAAHKALDAKDQELKASTEKVGYKREGTEQNGRFAERS
ncbi:hypothetical protein GUJ93_ZPchr0320g33496 [Zizania palustris]|uniref:Uncharacterized protein n=1 Tax=Zizania palustris TaxID=103762 RepID=A0A8J5QYY5_ZIZPA|nr:hypothetical protein GUJ93_ZPchr0320g33496 [Zizania palustris]